MFGVLFGVCWILVSDFAKKWIAFEGTRERGAYAYLASCASRSLILFSLDTFFGFGFGR